LSQLLTEPQNPQIRSQILGEYPDGLTLRVTSDREVELTELEYLDATEAKLIESNSLHEHGKDFRIPIDYSKLVKINNLMRADGGPFRMKFRLEMLFGGRSTSHVVPVLIEPSYKPINGTPTYFLTKDSRFDDGLCRMNWERPAFMSHWDWPFVVCDARHRQDRSHSQRRMCTRRAIPAHMQAIATSPPGKYGHGPYQVRPWVFQRVLPRPGVVRR
jgi:hypothetical protein